MLITVFERCIREPDHAAMPTSSHLPQGSNNIDTTVSDDEIVDDVSPSVLVGRRNISPFHHNANTQLSLVHVKYDRLSSSNSTYNISEPASVRDVVGSRDDDNSTHEEASMSFSPLFRAEPDNSSRNSRYSAVLMQDDSNG